MMRSDIRMKSEHEHVQFTLSVVKHIITFTSTPYRAPYNTRALWVGPRVAHHPIFKCPSRAKSPVKTTVMHISLFLIVFSTNCINARHGHCSHPEDLNGHIKRAPWPHAPAVACQTGSSCISDSW